MLMQTPGSGTRHATREQLAALAPLAALSPERVREIADLTVVEHAVRGTDPIRGRTAREKSLFLLSGEVLLVFEGGGTLVVVGGTQDARHALNRRNPAAARAKAITDADLVEIDDDTLDILATWDQVASSGAASGSAMALAIRSDAGIVSSAFSLAKLRGGLFSQLPTAHIDELYARFRRVGVARGEVIVREGDEGDSYYVVESGRCQVERMVGGARVVLAELRGGDAFGEEALVSEAKRNATVLALSECQLLQLGKRDFDELLRDPLLRRAGFADASERVRRGALWLDVRYPSEYQYNKLPGAINVPLAEVRNMFAVLDKSKEYIVYCQSGRRSAAAAFLFAQRGFNVWLLEGGLWAAERAV
jgi:CRP-like cAMP-binding protein